MLDAQLPGRRHRKSAKRPRRYIDSACYFAAFYGTIRRASARFPVTLTMDPKIAAASAAIG